MHVLSLQYAGIGVLKFLISKNFDIDAPRNPNSFSLAIKKGDLQVLKYVHSLNPELYLETNSITKTTSLCEALRHRHVVKYLIEDLDFQYKKPPKNMLLHAASFYYTTPDSFQYLIDTIGNSDELLHKLDKEGRSATDLALKNTELYKFLVKVGLIVCSSVRGDIWIPNAFGFHCKRISSRNIREKALHGGHELNSHQGRNSLHTMHTLHTIQRGKFRQNR